MEELINVQARLNKLDNDKLIDVVKNYKQYGYSEEIRNYTLTLLQQKGISEEDLRLTGNLQNHSNENIERVFTSFKTSSTIAFISYLILVVTRLAMPHVDYNSDLLNVFLLILGIISIVIFLGFLIRSFLIQSEFYKITGDDYSSGALIYFLVGMPFYLIMYFVFLNQMKEKMKTIS